MGRHARSVLVSVILAAMAVSGCGGSPPGPAGERAVDIESTLPDMGDLPKGYRVGDNSRCGVLGVEGATPAMADLLQRAWLASAQAVSFCAREFRWAWRDAGANSLLVSAHVIRWPDDAFASQALDALPDPSRWTSGIPLTPSGPSPGIGEESLILTGTDLSSAPGVPVMAAAWRDDDVVGLVLATEQDPALARATVERLAGLMRERTRGDRAPSDPKLDDRTVPIDDPGLDTPVWWLGERWTGGSGLPELELAYTFAPYPVDLRTGPGNSAEVQYRHLPAGEGPSGGVIIMTWTRSDWRRYAATALGRSATRPKCARVRTVPRDGGSATLITIPEGKPPDATAPGPDCSATGRETMTWAVAELGDAVVTVNLPICLFCFVRGSPDDPFDTPAGIEAVVRGLERRS